MRWIRFSTEGRTAYGVVNGSTVNQIGGEPWGMHRLVGKPVERRREPAIQD